MFCHFCGKELEDGSKFCMYCGKNLGEDTAAEAAENAAEAVEEAAAEAVEAVTETAEQAAETAAETAISAAEEAKTAAEEIAEAVSETAEPVEEAAAEAVEAVTETAEQAAETAAETAISAAEEAKTAAEEIAEAISEPAEIVKETAETAAETAEVAAPPEEIAIETEKQGGVMAVVRKNKTALIIAAAAVVFVLLVVLIACFGGASSGSGSGIKGAYYIYNDSGECGLIYNGKKIKGTDISTAVNVSYSSDGSKAVLNDGNKALYYLSDGKVSKITEDFETFMLSISADGSTVVYVYDDAIYTYKNGKSSKAADIEDKLSTLVVSPNGDTIAYSEIDGDRVSAYAVKGGKKIDLDAKVQPFSVSNGGGIIYGLDRNSKLCYIKNLKADSAESVKAMSFNVIPVLSSDCKQIMFASDNGTYYFDSSLKEEIKVTGSTIDLAYPAGGTQSYDDLKSFVAYSDGKIIKFTRKGDDFEKETIVSSTTGFMLSADGKSILYTQFGDLYRVSVSNPDKKEQLGSEAVDWDADFSLKNVYFVNSDGALRYADGKSKNGKKIMDDVGDFVVNLDGVCVFTDDDDTLYYSAGGGDRKKAGLEDVEYIETAYNAVFVRSDGDLYVSTDGKKFTKV
ncbi:MAG: zinc ribbon domain-containing protein [Lachnospiraceae bacterium]|nr:zinc ribbon domain-containing protein [Ruminococcus sp.]MCM1274589.1 zinc ribbon domain-containing protein [Lachnospiraceae bacterium]